VVLQSGLEAALGEGWLAVLHALGEAQHKLTRQEVLAGWPPDHDKPDATTLWRWLSGAVAQGLVRQEGTGHRRDPYRYWLPQREELMRPDGGSVEEMQAWNARCVAELLAGMERASGAGPTPEAPRSGDEGPTAAPAVADLPAEVVPLEPVPPPVTGPQPAESASPAPGPPPSQAAQPAAPDEAARLPYPWNIMNPAEVPEEVWKRARAGQENAS
jgi:hypothetical protein